MKVKCQVYKNYDDLQKWEDDRERNEDLGISKPEEILVWETLHFRKKDLRQVYKRGDGNYAFHFKNTDFCVKPTLEVDVFIEDHFKEL